MCSNVFMMRGLVAVCVFGLLLGLSESVQPTKSVKRCLKQKEIKVMCLTGMDNNEDPDSTITPATVQRNQTEERNFNETSEVLQTNGTMTEQTTALPQTRAKRAPTQSHEWLSVRNLFKSSSSGPAASKK
ncbi:hypothetical protein NQD34_014937 [Periophthalmus magnuspinnatus]|nr:hypothetical protein NQD34_014937 [Periophthalmus magnuspinnatus]